MISRILVLFLVSITLAVETTGTFKLLQEVEPQIYPIISVDNIYDSSKSNIPVQKDGRLHNFFKASLEWVVYNEDTIYYSDPIVNTQPERTSNSLPVHSTPPVHSIGFFETSDQMKGIDPLDLGEFYFSPYHRSEEDSTIVYYGLYKTNERRDRREEWNTRDDGDLFGYSDGYDLYINYQERGFNFDGKGNVLCKIHKYKEFSWFWQLKEDKKSTPGLGIGAVSVGVNTVDFSDELYILNMETFQKYHISRRLIRRMLSQVPELEEEFNSGRRVSKGDFSQWIDRLFTTLEDRGESVNTI